MILDEDRYISFRDGLVEQEELKHYNVKGSKWYKHKFGKYQKHAKYAMGRADPETVRSVIDILKKRIFRRSGSKAKNPTFDEPEVESLSELRKKEKSSDITADIKATNPDFPKPGSTDNCVFCSATYEMRRRGYDVEARKTLEGMSSANYIDWFPGVDPVGFTIDDVKKDWYDIPREDKVDAINDGVKWTTKDDLNARGFLTFTWANLNYGHIINWEMKNGETRFIDAQSGSLDVSDCFDLVDPESIRICRLDNLEPAESITKTLMSRRGK